MARHIVPIPTTKKMSRSLREGLVLLSEGDFELD